MLRLFFGFRGRLGRAGFIGWGLLIGLGGAAVALPGTPGPNRFGEATTPCPATAAADAG